MITFRASFRHELLSSARSRSPQLIIAVFLVLTSISSIIGWLTVRNVTKIYSDIVSQGLTRAPNPFTGTASLYYMRDSVIYIVLVGSLMAIVLGAQTSLRDRNSSADVLIKTRNVSLLSRALGQLSAIGTIIAGLEAVALVASILTIWMIQKTPLSLASFVHLLSFGAISGLLMLAIASLGFAFGLYARSEESALLYPIVTWAIITFTVPQIITSTHPVALLNPTPAIATGTGLAQSMVNTFSPLMLMEHFKYIANSILSIDSSLKLSTTSIVSFAAFVAFALTGSISISAKAFGRKLNV
ncbi:MAG: ABC transporter permease [Actinobacteria bacterium]|nr:ABC transporter permease [Actinomycetota bacterium]